MLPITCHVNNSEPCASTIFHAGYIVLSVLWSTSREGVKYGPIAFPAHIPTPVS